MSETTNTQNNDLKHTAKKRASANSTTRDMLGLVALLLVSSLVVLFIALNFGEEESTVVIEDRYKSFSSDWRLQYGDFDEVVDLPFLIEAAPNQKITLTKNLSTISQFYAVATRNYHQKLTAYVDGQLIYEFPDESHFFTDAVITDDWNIIHLSEDMTGKEFTLVFQTGEYGFTGNLQPIYLGEDNSLIHYIRSITAVPYGMAISVLVLGLILVILGMVYSKYNADRCQVVAGLMLMAIGVWITNRSKMPILLVGSSFKFYLAYISLSIEAILILLYVGEKFKNKHKKRTNIITIGCAIYSFLTFTIVHFIDYPLDQAVPFSYGAIFLAAIYLIVMLWPISFGKETARLTPFILKSNRIEFVATVIMVLGVCGGILVDFVLGKDRLWTDIGVLPKISLNAYAIGQLLVHIYRGYYNVEEREELQGKLHDSQMELMMGQIQPHFIFNTLSSIRTLVKVDPDTAYNMLYDFSNYLRANVDNVTNLDGIKFAAEVEHITSYVNIEKVRFGDRLNVEYDILSKDFIVPPLSIQPLVENAIKHGVTKKVEGGTVWLRSYMDGQYNVVEVEDNGIGMPPDKLEELKATITGQSVDGNSEEEYIRTNFTGNGSEDHKSSGMKNIGLRLRELTNAEFHIVSIEGRGTKIIVRFPH